MASTTQITAGTQVRQSEMVVDSIKAMIGRGDLSAGQRLPIEKELAADLNVSRGSLREGVRALCMMGVLETRQGDGTYVTSLEPGLMLAPVGFLVDLQDTSGGIAEIQAIRRVLEAEAAHAATLRATPEDLAAMGAALDEVEPLLAQPAGDYEQIIEGDRAFHRLIAEATGNRALAALIEALGGRTMRARLWRARNEPEAGHRAQAEHRAILAAISSREPAHAAILMSHHLLGVEEYFRGHDITELSTDAQTERQ